MTTTVQGPRGVNNCLKDATPPPTPGVVTSIAFERANEGAVVHAGSANVGPRRNPDPAYFELQNVEVGTTIQLINLSKNPAASWDKENTVELTMTGRDVQNRRASFYLTNEQMEAIGLQPGDMLQLRAVDESGNASAPVSTELLGNEWAGARVQEGNTFSRGGNVNALDGEGLRKNVIAKAVNDARPPMMDEARLSFATWTQEAKDTAKTIADAVGQWKPIVNKDWFGHDEAKALAKNEALPENVRAAFQKLVDDPVMYRGFDQAAGRNGFDTAIGLIDLQSVAANSVTLQGDFALEPGAVVRVSNQRTGEQFSATVGQDRGLAVHLKNVTDGDPLHITPTDNNGVAGQTVELVYSSRCKDGKAPKLKNGISARLPGVL